MNRHQTNFCRKTIFPCGWKKSETHWFDWIRLRIMVLDLNSNQEFVQFMKAVCINRLERCTPAKVDHLNRKFITVNQSRKFEISWAPFLHSFLGDAKYNLLRPWNNRHDSKNSNFKPKRIFVARVFRTRKNSPKVVWSFLNPKFQN